MMYIWLRGKSKKILKICVFLLIKCVVYLYYTRVNTLLMHNIVYVGACYLRIRDYMYAHQHKQHTYIHIYILYVNYIHKILKENVYVKIALCCFSFPFILWRQIVLPVVVVVVKPIYKKKKEEEGYNKYRKCYRMSCRPIQTT